LSALCIVVRGFFMIHRAGSARGIRFEADTPARRTGDETKNSASKERRHDRQCRSPR